VSHCLPCNTYSTKVLPSEQSGSVTSVPEAEVAARLQPSTYGYRMESRNFCSDS
jgi:hypothetical protein